MDNFVASLKKQTIRLDGFDDLTSLLTIPIYFWYEKPVPADVLELAFYKTLEEFPILAGRIKTGYDSRNYVDIDKDHLNLPEYTDYLCNVHFQTLKDADFDVNLLPVDYSSSFKTPQPPGIFGNCMKLAEFHVIRLKDDSGMGVFANITHFVFDGTAYCDFMNRWAYISKSLLAAQKQKQQDIHDVSVPARVFQFDRSILETDKPTGTDALEPEVCHMFSASTVVSRWVAWVSPELRGRIYRYMLSSMNPGNYSVRLSSSAIEHLLQLIRPLAEPGISHLSANDAIAALATILFAQALHKAGRLEGVPVILSNIVADMRPRVKRLANINYAGNAALQKMVVSPLDLLLKDHNPQVLAAVACNVRRAVDSVDETYCKQLGHLIYNNPCSHATVNLQVPSMKNLVASTNHSRFKYYDVDFGSGIPAIVRPVLHIIENGIITLPAHPSQGGYVIMFFMAPEVAGAMVESEYWKYLY
ncbi:hypothetical protein LPJ81_003771 [Coemansia sp. IMI 209127]|nr:hypothetical protein LPJ81_003771 [Coemansia sp. IMI 209127]